MEDKMWAVPLHFRVGMIKKYIHSLRTTKNRVNRLLTRFGTVQYRINYLRRQGMKIGKDCMVFSGSFGSEPYLIEIGDHVAIAANCTFINHEGAEWLVRDKYQNLNVFGKIIIGDNTFIGMGCTLLPGTEIGANCIIGASSVVRGKIANNSVVLGNPAKVVMKTSMIVKQIINHKHRLDTRGMEWEKEREILLKHFSG